MNIARPSKADIDAVLNLNSIFSSIESGVDPTIGGDGEDDGWLDLDDDETCRRVLRHILDSLPRGGGFGRFVWGMATLCDPRNGIIDQGSDVLALHPNLRRADKETTK